MGEIKTVYLEGQFSVTDPKRDVAKNTKARVEIVLEVKTANEWIEKAKKNQILYSPFGTKMP